MNWTALVPLKPQAERKSRLAERLSSCDRAQLSRDLFGHVAAVLASVPGIAKLVVLADQRPEGWSGGWLADGGAGLNAELQATPAARPLLVIHADLPMLTAGDVSALLAAAEAAGSAIAPDRHDSGTNALALADGAPFVFRFGADSFAKHRLQMPQAAVVRRPGLALDLDTPDDLDAAAALGWTDQ